MAEKKKGEWACNPKCWGECGQGPRNNQFNAKQGWGWSWIFWPFGLIGPLIGAMIGLVFLIICLWILKFVNIAIQSPFISLMIGAVAANIWVFFAFSLVMGYLDFLAKRSPLAYTALWPVSNGLGVAFAAWVIAWVFRAIGALASVPFLLEIGTMLRANLAWVFVLFLMLGYLSLYASRKR